MSDDKADVKAWRRRYEDAVADGSFRDWPSAKEQIEAVRSEFYPPATETA